jgi:hypothetical protein
VANALSKPAHGKIAGSGWIVANLEVLSVKASHVTEVPVNGF